MWHGSDIFRSIGPILNHRKSGLYYFDHNVTTTDIVMTKQNQIGW